MEGRTVTEVGPGGDLGEGLANSLKDGRTVNGVEGILDVNEDHDLVCVVAVPVHPLSGSMNYAFGPMRSATSNLDWFEHVSRRRVSPTAMGLRGT